MKLLSSINNLFLSILLIYLMLLFEMYINRIKNRLIRKIIQNSIFFVYILGYIYVTLLSRTHYGVYYYSLILFKAWLEALGIFEKTKSRLQIVTDILLNIILDIPFGFFVSDKFQEWKKRSTAKVILCVGCISLITELLQLLFRIGVFEIDDIINNSIGGWIGSLLYLRIRNKNRKEGAEYENRSYCRLFGRKWRS